MFMERFLWDVFTELGLTLSNWRPEMAVDSSFTPMYEAG